MCSTSVIHVFMIMMYNARMCLTSKGVQDDDVNLQCSTDIIWMFKEVMYTT